METRSCDRFAASGVCVCEQLVDLVRQNVETPAQHGFVGGEADPQTLVTVRPAFIVESKEKVVAGDDQDATLFEPLVELGRRDRQAF